MNKTRERKEKREGKGKKGRGKCVRGEKERKGREGEGGRKEGPKYLFLEETLSYYVHGKSYPLALNRYENKMLLISCFSLYSAWSLLSLLKTNLVSVNGAWTLPLDVNFLLSVNKSEKGLKKNILLYDSKLFLMHCSQAI